MEKFHKIIKIHRKLLPAPKGAGLTEFSSDSGFLGCQKSFIQHLKMLDEAFLCIKRLFEKVGNN